MRTHATLLIVLLTLLAGVAPAGAVAAPGAATAPDAGAADHALQQEVPDCSYPFTATDATGENVTLEEPPETVTTLGPSATQTMWEIGGKEQVVGLGTYSYYLADAETRTNVSAAGFGYSTEAVVGTEADLVLASNIASDDTVSALRDAGMTVFKFGPSTSVEDVANKTTMIGKLTGNCVGAAEANAWMTANVEAAADVTADVEEPEVLVPLGGSSLAGGGTFIDAMVTTAGGTNLAADAFDSPYPYGVSDERIIELDPEMLVLQEGSESLIQSEPYSLTTAGQNNASVVVDGNWLSQPAPRSVVFATRNLTEGFHPDAAANAEWTARSEVTIETETATPTEAVTEAATPESTATPEPTSTDSPGFGGAAAVAALGAGVALLARRD